MLLPILIGAALGAAFIGLARTWRGGEVRMLAIGLVVAALAYLAFALPTRNSRWVLIELGGVVVFGLLAWAGRAAPVWLALGWTAHVAWDVGLHLDRAQPVVGTWYPLLCVGFDLVIAGNLLRGDRASR